MKKILFISVIALSAMFASCAKKQAQATEEPTICGKWELAAINNNAISATENQEAAYVIFNLKDSTIAAFDGCNNIGGWIVKADSGNLVMVDLASTLQFCPEQGESAMLGAILNVADKYKINECAEHGKFLVLSSSTDSISAIFKEVPKTK
ncbi:MAG: META domain-containing protein [Bacteroidales bacterium]|nr:META domain-containing protein [Bacteroidales bacterium]